MRRLASASPRSIRVARVTSWAAVSSLCRLMAAKKRASESAGSGTIPREGVGFANSRGGSVFVDQSAEEVLPVQMFARAARVARDRLAAVGW